MFMFMCTCTCICSIAWAFHHVQCAEDALYVWICSVYGCACLLLCAAFPFFASCERACEKKLSTHVPKAALVFGCSANNVCELGQCSFACSKTYIEYGDGGVYTMNCHSPHDVGHFPSAKNLHTLRSLTHSLVHSLSCSSLPLCVPPYKCVYLRFHFQTNVIMNHQAPWAMIPHCCCCCWWWCAHRNAHILFHYNNSIITKYPR